MQAVARQTREPFLFCPQLRESIEYAARIGVVPIVDEVEELSSASR